MESFDTYAKEQFKLIENAQDLLEGNNLLSPFSLFGESPDAYYERTVHAGNVGIYSIDAVTNYCDIALTLPTIDESVRLLYGSA